MASLSAGFTLKAVEIAMGGCWFGREHVDLLVSDQNSWNWFFNKLQPMQRFNEESSDVAKAGLSASPAAAKSAESKSSLIKLDPEMGTDCKQAMSRAAVTTEREDTLTGDATVCSVSNVKIQKSAEMTDSLPQAA